MKHPSFPILPIKTTELILNSILVSNESASGDFRVTCYLTLTQTSKPLKPNRVIGARKNYPLLIFNSTDVQSAASQKYFALILDYKTDFSDNINNKINKQ